MVRLNGGYRLIAIDLDGTLLTSDKRITQRTRKALHSAVEMGMLVVICTGRGLPQSTEVLRGIDICMPLVLHNGAMIAEYPTGKVIGSFPLRMDLARRAIRVMKEIEMTPAIYDYAEGEHLLVCEKGACRNPALNRYIEGKGETLRWVKDLTEYVDHDVVQVMTIDQREIVSRAIERLGRKLSEARIITSGRVYSDSFWFLEVLARNASKAKSLERLGRIHGISPMQMVAIGDNFNDLNMFRYVGLSVAMANAPEEVKRSADIIAPSNDEEGVAEIVEDLIFRARRNER
ncbi:HAD family phosphatase [Candidatus Poribacteria bacterium]|nr:HAD family phosphatase [Candidatus Poribacteria bacterium]